MLQCWSKLQPNDTRYQMLAVLNLLAVTNYLLKAFWYLQFDSCFNHILITKQIVSFCSRCTSRNFWGSLNQNMSDVDMIWLNMKKFQVCTYCYTPENILKKWHFWQKSLKIYIFLLRKCCFLTVASGHHNWTKMTRTQQRKSSLKTDLRSSV